MFSALLYVLSYYVLLLALVIDIIYSVHDSTLVVMINFLKILKIFWTIFLGLSWGLGLLARAFCFVFEVVIVIFTDHFSNSFTSCFDLFIYGLLTIMTCLVSKAQTRKYFIISLLYLINITSHNLRKSDLNRFFGGISIKTRLPKMHTYSRFYLLPVQLSLRISSPWFPFLVKVCFVDSLRSP